MSKVCLRATLLVLVLVPVAVHSTYLDIANNWNPKAITEDCLEKSNRHDCSVFNRCCDHRCQQFAGHSSKAHFCMAILGQIVEDRSECQCNSAISLRTRESGLSGKLDIIAGVVLIFIIDIVLLSFSL